MKTILVTGGCGFIGSHFIREFLKKHPDFKLVNLDKLTYAGNLDNLKDFSGHKNYKFIKGDIADPKSVAKVFQSFRPDFVINFAAESHVDRSIHGFGGDFINTNIYGVFNLLENANKFGLEKFVQVSTDEVYGSLDLNSSKKFTEETRYQPRSIYSASKASGDFLANSYFSTWGLPVTVTHCSNNYGTHQYPEKLIPYFTLRAMTNNPLPLYGDGKNVRDWIYVLDHCRALELVLLKGKAGEVYNIGADNELSNIDLAKKILDILGKPHSLISFIKDRPGHDRCYAIDASKIKRELGWKVKYRFDQMLEETINWYVGNPEWTKKVQKKTGVFNPHMDL
ncbi:MAG: dTDP-glucose 4,6-dehydratase [Parcubacteria group bacterium]|nr:dTDP-glucose 4,6-dehydratase [Parcubacteria group bacterium]